MTDQTFDQEVLHSNKPVLVDFFADWCGPCKMIAPVLTEVDKELGNDVIISKVNVDHNPMVSVKNGIMSIPTLKLFKNGKVVQTIVGLQSKSQLVNMIINHL
ncbi:thioredoxin [Paenibacillus filicis]|uniref:Thioredoxin n=1 Tax=Paenibacillus gyeongsangnamensis TaxID=3388067 RepID=A0ABT4Q9X4_9BACL|nr:thioredoxin [Paenibacillus filicis]MCZ8513683.1 thioredoxin [Paenibacillus filicis]